MSWFSLPKLVTDYWSAPPPEENFSIHDDMTGSFVVMGTKKLDEKLVEAITDYLPIDGEDFKKTLRINFNLKFLLAKPPGLFTGVWFVGNQTSRSLDKMALRIINVDPVPENVAKTRHFNLAEGLTGIEWLIFFPSGSYYASPDYAIAKNLRTQEFEVLSKEVIRKHLNRTECLQDQYTIYATLTPVKGENEPLYVDSIPPRGVADQLQGYLPKRNTGLFNFKLATHLRDLQIGKLLGKGAFASVWQVEFKDQENQPSTMALRLIRTDELRPVEREKCFELRKDHFGGEFNAFLPSDPHILSTYYAIVWDSEKGYCFLSANDIKAYKNKTKPIDNKTITLYGTLSQCHEGAQTLEDYMKGEGVLDLVTIRTIATQLFLALNAFEGMHRDLKPANILITKEGHVILIDFGFSIAKDSLKNEMAQSILGSPLFMAWEILFNRLVA